MTAGASQVGPSKSAFDGCTFDGNSAKLRGEAIQNYDVSNTTMRSSAFRDNITGTRCTMPDDRVV